MRRVKRGTRCDNLVKQKRVLLSLSLSLLSLSRESVSPVFLQTNGLFPVSLFFLRERLKRGRHARFIYFVTVISRDNQFETAKSTNTCSLSHKGFATFALRYGSSTVETLSHPFQPKVVDGVKLSHRGDTRRFLQVSDEVRCGQVQRHGVTSLTLTLVLPFRLRMAACMSAAWRL